MDNDDLIGYTVDVLEQLIKQVETGEVKVTKVDFRRDVIEVVPSCYDGNPYKEYIPSGLMSLTIDYEKE